MMRAITHASARRLGLRPRGPAALAVGLQRPARALHHAGARPRLLLGIVGGSLMLMLLLYPARKRADWLRFIGGVPLMVPAAHDARHRRPDAASCSTPISRLGATNSNVALFCMLAVVRQRHRRPLLLHAASTPSSHGRQATSRGAAEHRATAAQAGDRRSPCCPTCLAPSSREERHLLEPAHGPVRRAVPRVHGRRPRHAGALAAAPPDRARRGARRRGSRRRWPRTPAGSRPPRCRYADRRLDAVPARARVSRLHAAVLAVARAARAVLHHDADRRNRARDFGADLLKRQQTIRCHAGPQAGGCA